ncbi:MAG: DinB family protein [Bacteroidota bacterium]
MSDVTLQTALREHLHELLQEESAHLSFEAAVEGLAPHLYGRIPQGLPYSAWQLLEHVRLAQRDILEFCTDPAYVAPEWPSEYWPDAAEPRSAEAWANSLAAYRRDREELMTLLDRTELDLLANVPQGEGQTFLREFLLVADHTAYHTGQMIVLRRLLDDWPPAA